MGNCRTSATKLAAAAGWILAGSLLMACGGGGGKGAASADDAEAASGDTADSGGKGSPSVDNSVSEENTFCIDSTIGQRYLVEDALDEAGLETEDSCLAADVMIQERGESGAYELRYQKVGAGEWATCESSLDKQTDFLASCVREMVGGAAPMASAE